MVRLQDTDPRFKYLELKTGIMVLVVLVGLFLLILFLGMERDLFTKKYTIYFVADSGEGFIQGMPVRLSGFKVGRVKKFELIEGANVKVSAEINRKHQKWLHLGSKARIAKEGYIGDSYVELTVGDTGARTLDDGDTIPFERKAGVEELIKEAKPVLMEIKEIIHFVNDPEGDIRQMIGNMKELSFEIRETRRKMDIMLDKAGPALDKADRIMANIEGLTERMGPTMERVESMVENVHAATARLPETTRKLDGIVDDIRAVTGPLGGEGQRIRELIENADEAARDGRKVVGGIKGSWPVRLMLPPPRTPELVPADGFIFKEPPDG